MLNKLHRLCLTNVVYLLFATKFVEQTASSVLHKCPIYICCFLHKNNYKVFQSNIFASLQLLILVRNCELVAWCLLYQCSLKKVWNMIIQLLEYALPLLILLCHQKIWDFWLASRVDGFHCPNNYLLGTHGLSTLKGLEKKIMHIFISVFLVSCRIIHLCRNWKKDSICIQ